MRAAIIRASFAASREQYRNSHMSSPDASREQYDSLWRDLWANCHAGGPMARTRYRLAMRWLDFGRASRARVLDVGAGNGAFMAQALRRAPQLDIYGAEFSQAAIDIAHPSIRPRLALCDLQSQQALPWGGDFKLITCMEVLEHLPDDRLALQNIARAISPGGSLFITVPAWEKNWGPQDVTAGHVRRYEPTAMRALIQSAGLRIKRLSCWGGMFTWMYLRAGDLIGPEKVMSVNPSKGLAGIAAESIYQVLRLDSLFSIGRGPQLLALATKE
jgi:2-polyprenyl-3-methyl-5-hydroxy-6-metoxy-1,4-benzoquinol methylase